MKTLEEVKMNQILSDWMSVRNVDIHPVTSIKNVRVYDFAYLDGLDTAQKPLEGLVITQQGPDSLKNPGQV